VSRPAVNGSEVVKWVFKGGEIGIDIGVDVGIEERDQWQRKEI
jgi:hypothetical protein